MELAEKAEMNQDVNQNEGVTFSTLVDRLGRAAATEFYKRIDDSQRQGGVIVPATVRDARMGFSKAHKPGNAQFVVPGRKGAREPEDVLSDSVVMIKMDDLEAVVKAGRQAFSWSREFAPRAGLPAADTTPIRKRGSRGHRQLRD